MNRYPAGIYLLNVNNKRLEQGVTWRCKDAFIVNFEHISHLVLVFLLLIWTRNCWMGKSWIDKYWAGVEMIFIFQVKI